MKLIDFYRGDRIESTLASIKNDRLVPGASFSMLLNEVIERLDNNYQRFPWIYSNINAPEISNILSKLMGFYSICYTETDGIREIMEVILSHRPDEKILRGILEHLRSSSTTYKNFTLKLREAMLEDPHASNSC